jgi:rhamnogalacturonyl hydrolase YesR
MKKTNLVLASVGLAVLSRGAFAAEDLSFVEPAIARFAANYKVLLGNAERAYTKEAPYPKSFRDGKVVFCKDWDWCSGFFQGCLWYLHEATGEASWRAAAERYTEE